MNKIKDKKDRFSLDFPSGAKEQLDELRAKSGASTLTEMFRRAVTYYEFLLDAQARGFRIVLENPTTKEKEVLRML